MTQRPLTADDIRSICNVLGEGNRRLIDSIEQRLQDQDCPQLLERGKLLFECGTELLDPSVIELFRSSEWCLRQWKFPQSAENYTIDIQRKQYVVPTPNQCFHATPAENETGIIEQGLVIGRVAGNHNSPRFADSVHFIHASLSNDDAVAWATRIFPGIQMVCFPVNLQDSGIRLFLDTAAGDSTAYVLEATEVSPSHLGEPIRDWS